MIRCLVLIFLSCCVYPLAAAEGPLLWDQTTAVLTPKSTDVAATALFKFQNIGKEPVVIKDVHPDCSCVTAPLAKTRYEPGENGQVAASFAIGRQIGEHTVTIEVKGSSGNQPLSTVLILHLKIVDVVDFSPRFLYWKSDEALEPKTVNLTLLPGEPISLREVRAGNPAFQVKLTATEDPRRFILVISPPTQHTRSICPITVITESSDHTKTQEHGMVARLL